MPDADSFSIEELHRFIVEAKEATYSAAKASQIPPTRADAEPLVYVRDKWEYVDRFVGGQDFVGQAIVALQGHPVWAMNYHGFVLAPQEDLHRLAEVLKASLKRVYHEERFLGDALLTRGRYIYQDTNAGDVRRFQGEERIYTNGELVYKLWYHGGLIG